MLQINVLVAATAPDIEAEGIAAAVAERMDMTLVEGRVLTVAEMGTLLESTPLSEPCAVVLVGPHTDTEEPAERYLAERPNFVVMRVDAPVGDVVRIALHGVGLEELLSELRALVDHVGFAPRERVAQFRLRPVASGRATDAALTEEARGGTLLNAGMNWIHAVLRRAVGELSSASGDLPGLTVTAATVAELLDVRPGHAAAELTGAVKVADAALTQACAAADARIEPLAVIARVCTLSDLELRLVLLALAPELDPRYQRSLGLLLDDLGRRVGTLGLYAALLGEPLLVRLALGSSGKLAHWRVLDTHGGVLPPADEPLRLDPCLAAWILGERSAIARDPRVRRAIRLVRWPGASLLELESVRIRAASLVSKLQAANDAHWLLFAGDDASGWRALFELGAEIRQSPPIRVEGARVLGLDVAEIEESGVRIGRAARLSGRPLVLDVTNVAAMPENDDVLRLLIAAIGGTGSCAGVICADAPRVVRLLGSRSLALMEGPSLPPAARTAALRAAATGAGVLLSEEQAQNIARQYPLQIDGLEQAMRLARSDQEPNQSGDLRLDRFVSACKKVASEGMSHLADRIDPVFKLGDVVLPADRKQQLNEIVDNVRLAAYVLDGWKFGEQLPYGRGVTVLLHGPSGTGKTMAALGVARQLGIQILRIDLSRVVSKYIGDTEKNIDRVFEDAQRSGSALLIDEADALLGKRSEVKDAHDRYANIEVAYLLQRMEAYEGLAILTTNLRQNLDPAFLRRLRFVVDFPRPDAEAREQIWRRCLPDQSHTLDAAAFRQLARKIDLTGGHIRQITLRAAFVAAAAGRAIGLSHIAYATNAEFAKLGMPVVQLDVTERLKAA